MSSTIDEQNQDGALARRGSTQVGQFPMPERQRVSTVEIVIPVYNEEESLPGCLGVLIPFLEREFPFTWKVTVVDNASTDGTRRIAEGLAAHDPRIRVLGLDRKGRGLALREAWGRSEATVVAYMDVDLSTDLNALIPLVGPLVNGHSDVAIGSRLAPGSRTIRGGRREVISRGYNQIIRVTHGASFSDAQCGFKAVRTDVLRHLLPRVEDAAWFFDTELLLLAQHNGLRIHEVPVDWVEDRDTRVDVVRTALDDLAGLARVARAKRVGTATIQDMPRRPAPRPLHPNVEISEKEDVWWQVAIFAVIGVLSTLITAVLYLVLRTWLPPLVANLIALVATTLWNTEANRRLTFAGRTQRSDHARVHIQGVVVLVLYYVITSGSLLALQAWDPEASRAAEVAVIVISSTVGTAVRFLLMRVWMFRRAPEEVTA